MTKIDQVNKMWGPVDLGLDVNIPVAFISLARQIVVPSQLPFRRDLDLMTATTIAAAAALLNAGFSDDFVTRMFGVEGSERPDLFRSFQEDLPDGRHFWFFQDTFVQIGLDVGSIYSFLKGVSDVEERTKRPLHQDATGRRGRDSGKSWHHEPGILVPAPVGSDVEEKDRLYA